METIKLYAESEHRLGAPGSKGDVQKFNREQGSMYTLNDPYKQQGQYLNWCEDEVLMCGCLMSSFLKS